MPTTDDALHTGWRRHQSGDVRGAEDIYRQVLADAPHNANGWCFLGIACHDQRRYDEAVAAYREALRHQPDFTIALGNLANTLNHQGLPREAEALCRRALDLNPAYATACTNLGVALAAQGRLEEASERFAQALALAPRDALAQANLGAALMRQGDYEAAARHTDAALATDPAQAEAHTNRAMMYLLHGDFARGWPEYEWRWQRRGSALPAPPCPRWNGEPLRGRSLLLLAEQGLGDTLQFIRYAAVLKAQGATRVLCKAQAALLPLLATYAHVDLWLGEDAPWPACDYHVPLLSVPGLVHTALANIPADVPYLRAPSELVVRWRERLARYDGFKIGIAWQGRRQFHADAERSLPLQQFARLAAVPGVRLFSLQKGHGSEQLQAPDLGFEVIDFGDELDGASGPFMDTAAIMENLDLVVSSCTSIAHLAGALGVPTWVAVSIAPDWRWLLGRDDSPWYPHTRLFRQARAGDWDEVFTRMAAVLDETVRAPKPASDSRELLAADFNRMKRGRHGVFLYNRHDLYVGRSLAEYGEFSEPEVALFARILRAGDVAVEAGANIGLHTVALAQLVGANGSVLAFEPQRIVFQTLCANLALNGLANVEAHHAALGARAGEIVVPDVRPDRENNFGGLALGQHTAGAKRPLLALDSLALPTCRLLKADVEGMEQAVLQGAADTLARCRPVLYLENDRRERSADLIAHVAACGYRLFWHLPPLFNPGNYFGNPRNVFGRIVSVNMLCLLPEHDIATDGLVEITDPASDWRQASAARSANAHGTSRA